MADEISFFAPMATAVIISVGGVIVNHFIYREKVNSLEKTMEKVSSEVKELRDKTIACETSLKEREREAYIKRKSPLALTDSGEKLLKDSGGDVFVNENFSLLNQKVEDHIPKTAYDVQELSQQVITWLKSEDVFNSIKDYAFKTGLPLEIIIEVMGIYLRDKILLEKGWNVKDIDRQTPA